MSDRKTETDRLKERERERERERETDKRETVRWQTLSPESEPMPYPALILL